MKKIIIVTLLTTVILLLALDALVRWFDPWGVQAYFRDLSNMYRAFRVDDVRGYVLPPGEYQFSHWRATILPDTTRRVPDDGGGCAVAFLGDSVTFGHGVNDGETWVNLLARALDIHAVNAGVDGYNVGNVWATRLAIPADAYVYTFVDNDNDPPLDWQHARPYTAQNVISDYWNWLIFSRQKPPRALSAQFLAELHDLASDPKVTVVAFDTGGLSNDIAAQVPVRMIPLWTQANSRADGHASAAGNREIAAAMAPIVRQVIEQACPVL